MLDEIRSFFAGVVGSPMHPKVERGIVAMLQPDNVTIHPYGFAIFKSGIEQDGYLVRCHVWLPGTRIRQTPDWPIHAHNSTLHSLILCGRLRALEWDVDLSGVERQLYKVGYEGGRSLLIRTDKKCSLVPRRDDLVVEGGHYEIPQGVMHSTEVGVEEACVTFVLSSLEIIGQSLVAGEIGGLVRYEHDREATAPEFAARATKVASGAVFGNKSL